MDALGGVRKVMKDIFKMLLVILYAVAFAAAIVIVGRWLSKFRWVQATAFQVGAAVAYFVMLTLQLIFSRTKIKSCEKLWVKSAAKVVEIIHWIAVVFYAAVLFS